MRAANRCARPFCGLTSARRTRCKALTARMGREHLAEWTGNPLAAGFMLASWGWLQENEPQTAARARWLMLPKDYVRFRLTGVMGSEPSDASSTAPVRPAPGAVVRAGAGGGGAARRGQRHITRQSTGLRPAADIPIGQCGGWAAARDGGAVRAAGRHAGGARRQRRHLPGAGPGNPRAGHGLVHHRHGRAAVRPAANAAPRPRPAAAPVLPLPARHLASGSRDPFGRAGPALAARPGLPRAGLRRPGRMPRRRSRPGWMGCSSCPT